MGKMKKYWKGSMLTVGVLLAGCATSLDDAQEETIASTKTAFFSEEKEQTDEAAIGSFYLPFGMDIESEETPNNVILESGFSTYILFYNDQEDEGSEAVYETLLDDGDVLFSESFVQGNQFGYVVGRQFSEKEYELTVGVGGVKLTTVTSVGDLSSEASAMMDIVNSFEPAN
ncbi:hypothetical protein [Bacillus fonticola]|uniref:hypothetical protein n=1 Tax=Bacillus fonticola TaxID=2728853 RepID=UPI0014758B1F|nr:hypothetical protein [Bacillus fonticola]